VEAGSVHLGGDSTPGGFKPLGVKRRRWREEIIRALLFLAAGVSILTTVGIVIALLAESIPFFQEVGSRFFTDESWGPLFDADPKYGIWQLLNGTFLITGIAILVAVPIGLASAVYLSEYAPPRVRKVVKPILEILVGVPTVVFGYFALTFVTPEVLNAIGLEVKSYNALAAGLVMGIMIVPTIASISEDAMRAVPQGLREGAYGLGSTRRQVATKVVFPAALSGIVASIVLGVSRGVGETMIVLLAAGLQPNFGVDPSEGFATITTFMGAAADGDNPAGTIGYQSIFACGFVLFVLTLAMNMIAIRFVRKYRQIYD
jgi:phosphate transport system permease protein